MSDHVDVWIPELVMGTLDGPTRTTVELHLRTCDRCAAEAVAMGEALSALALSLPPERPSATLRTRVLSSIVEEQQRRDRRFEEGRFHGFVDRLAEFFDVTIERARALVELLTDPAAWTPGPVPGIELIHLRPGPRFAHADAGFVRMAPGARFPYHLHVGDEFGIVLDGGLVGDDGTVVRAGECHDMKAGTSHSFCALPGDGCLFAALVRDGIRFTRPPQN